MENKKYFFDVFVPLGACTCNFEHFLDYIYKLVHPFKKYVEVRVKNSGTQEAEDLKILGNEILVKDGKTESIILRTGRTTKIQVFCEENLKPLIKNEENQ
jgi:hypothetical protein